MRLKLYVDKAGGAQLALQREMGEAVLIIWRIVDRPQERHREEEDSARLQYAGDLAEHGLRSGALLEHLGGHGAVDAAVGQRDDRAVPLQIERTELRRISPVDQIEAQVPRDAALRAQKEGFVRRLAAAHVEQRAMKFRCRARKRLKNAVADQGAIQRGARKLYVEEIALKRRHPRRRSCSGSIPAI